MTNNKERILITGIGALSNLGIGIKDSVEHIRQNKPSFTEKSEWTVEGLDKEYIGECAGFEFEKVFENPGTVFRYSQLSIMACKLALDDAGLAPHTGDSSRTGLIINSDLGASTAAENYAMKLYAKGPERVSPFDFTKSVANCVIGDTARQFKITGASSFIIGENSISYGFNLLQDGKADIIICGGVDELRDRTLWNYSRRGLTVPVNGSDPATNSPSSLPGENNRMLFGEGAAFVVLETESHAKQRGAKIYAEMLGEFSGCDSLCNEIIWERSPEDLSYNMRKAMEISGIGPEQVSFIMGASTLPWQVNAYEVPAIEEVWKNEPVKYSSIKCRTGETFSSSPVLSFALAAAYLSEGAIPGTGWPASLWQHNPQHIQMIAADESIGNEPACCLVNSIQLGGNTTSAIIKTYQ